MNGWRWQTCEGCKTLFYVPTHDADRFMRCPVRDCPGGPWRMLIDAEADWIEKIHPWRLTPKDYVFLLLHHIQPQPPRWDL